MCDGAGRGHVYGMQQHLLPPGERAAPANPTERHQPLGFCECGVGSALQVTYLEQFNVAAEREFGATVLSLTYVGELDRRMAYYLPDANTFPANTGVAGGRVCARTPALPPTSPPFRSSPREDTDRTTVCSLLPSGD